MRPAHWYRRSAAAFVLAAAATVLFSEHPGSRAEAGVVIDRLGEQDFASGAAPVFVADAKSAGADEPAPFDGSIFGDDRLPSFGKIVFAHHLASTPDTLEASLTLGLIGLDSPPGSKPTVKLFLDGVKQPNGAFAGVSTAEHRSSASVVTVPVPLDLLSDGMLEVTVKSFRNGRGYPGNAIAADFSELKIVNLNIAPGNGVPGGGGGVPGGEDPDGGTPGDGGGGNGNPGGGTGGTTDPGKNPGEPGDNPGEPGGNTGGSGGNGSGGNGGEPIPAVPLPPATLLGGIGLLMAAWLKKRV